MREDSKILRYDVRDFNTFVGMDISKKEIVVSVRLPGEDDHLRWKLLNTKKGRARLIRKVKRQAVGKVLCCYEAGVCGYVLQQEMEKADVACVVISPSLTPIKPGDQIKTDRRDADKLAKYLAKDELTEVFPPTPEEIGVRDLCRARESAVRDSTAYRHRILKLLLRLGVEYTEGRKNWTKRHTVWLKQIRLENKDSQLALEDTLLALDQLEGRIKYLEAAIVRAAETDVYREAVGVLSCFRGIKVISAMSLLTEIYNICRFRSAAKLMSYLGIVPREHSTGESVRRGGITKAGNSRARRTLIEISKHARRRVVISEDLKKRRENQPAWAIAIADKCMYRSHGKYWNLVMMKNKPNNVATVAVAREQAGFIWAVLVELESRRAQAMARQAYA